jgi:hypothetical protein
MEQMQMNFEGEPKPPTSELDLEIESIMNNGDPSYKNNKEAAEKLAKLRIEHRKSGKPTVEYHDHYDD